jgi:hypothetical protein
MSLRWHFACLFASLLAAAQASSAYAGDPFPFGSELMLDVAPMHGSKRMPMLEIEDDGSASIDLWCMSLRGRATVTDATIAIVPGQPVSLIPGQPAAGEQTSSCDPDRQAGDAALIAALAQVTTWRRAGDVVELLGAATLRYRLMTN